ncbi:MAG: HEAT repeat domain-containing protein [Leptospiraceae bacterium]
MKYTKLLAYGLTVVLATSPLWAGAEDDAKAYYAKRSEQALKDLDFGTMEQKLLAIYYMGAPARHQFVRPLGRELLEDLEDPALRNSAPNDPMVKAHIAWALGQIGNDAGVSYLLEAADKVNAIIEEKRKAVEAARQKRSAESHEFLIQQDEPGPFLASTEVPFPYSPDTYWSVADEFKSVPAVNLKAEDHRARIQGYNYVNVLQQIFIALGKIRQKESAERIVPFLDHPYPAIRQEAALALGKIGSLAALEGLERSFQKEKEPAVRIRIAFSIFLNDHTRTKYYEEILTMLKDDDVRVRLEAAKALRELALGESITPLFEARRLEESTLVRTVIDQAIENAEHNNLFPPNPQFDTGPNRVWTYGRPVRPRN